LWKRAVRTSTVPELPGDWLVQGTALVRLPVGPVACAVVRNNSGFGSGYYAHVTLQPLYVPADTWQATLGFRLGERTAQSLRPGFDTPEEGAESMRELAGLVRAEALPHFERYGTPDGFLELCRSAAAEHPAAGRVHLLRQQAATEILLGERDAALATLDAIAEVAHATTDAPAWLSTHAEEAERLSLLVDEGLEKARAELSDTETRTRAAFRLPAHDAAP